MRAPLAMPRARARVVFVLFAAGAAILGVAASCVSAAESASHDAPKRAFDRVVVGLHGAAISYRDPFADYWEAGPGVALDATTPFYVGDASLLLRVSKDEARPGTLVPDHTAMFIGLGWWAGRDIAGPVRIEAGFTGGATEWIFDEDVADSARFELELGTEAGARLRWSFASRWSAVVSGTYQWTFTHERVESTVISVGLARSFGAPGWVRSVLE